MEKNTNCVYKTNYILAECIIKFLDFLLEIDISEKKTKKQPHFFFWKNHNILVKYRYIFCYPFLIKKKKTRFFGNLLFLNLISTLSKI